MGQLLNSASNQNFNPYNFPLTISMTEPTPKAVGHIWVKSDAGAQITNVVIDDAARITNGNGSLMLIISDNNIGYDYFSGSKYLTNGRPITLKITRHSINGVDSLPWVVGSINKKNVVNILRGYPRVYSRLNDTLNIETAYVWDGVSWMILSQSGKYFLLSNAVYNTLGTTFQKNIELVKDNISGGLRACISNNGLYVCVYSYESVSSGICALTLFKREGDTFIDITPNSIKSAYTSNSAIIYQISDACFSHDSSKLIIMGTYYYSGRNDGCQLLDLNNLSLTSVIDYGGGMHLNVLNKGNIAFSNDDRFLFLLYASTSDGLQKVAKYEYSTNSLSYVFKTDIITLATTAGLLKSIPEVNGIYVGDHQYSGSVWSVVLLVQTDGSVAIKHLPPSENDGYPCGVTSCRDSITGSIYLAESMSDSHVITIRKYNQNTQEFDVLTKLTCSVGIAPYAITGIGQISFNADGTLLAGIPICEANGTPIRLFQRSGSTFTEIQNTTVTTDNGHMAAWATSNFIG